MHCFVVPAFCNAFGGQFYNYSPAASGSPESFFFLTVLMTALHTQMCANYSIYVIINLGN